MEKGRISRKLEAIQKEIDQRNIGDFRIIKYEYNEELTLAGSFDFSYYHDIEIFFKNVSFIACPGSEFKANRIRLANEAEEEMLYKISHAYQEGVTICLEDTYFGHKFYLSVSDLEYQVQTVYYYKRDQLKPNERIADWVK
ncbi:hypothetical protein [Brevibacillus reuszeri]|uniref:hypothetical protein n=1 Tax=Brevibacillus reuszeri TaxID=54915 RepID=UPI002896D4D1|nr:hypothetical protein [Brevibacillus reuszeri]